jgi:dTDP-4-dehydrorhamnose 3,5-epimerase
MKFTPTSIPDVVLVQPKVHGDHRGFFAETWEARKFAAAGIPAAFVQDNHSRSARGVLRGLHYQLAQPQGKLVRVVVGEVYDVAVDLRRSSPTFGRWVGERLSAENHRMLGVPPGFAHGFLVLSEYADFVYKCTDFYDPASERSLLWNDPRVGIEWPLEAGQVPALSAKDVAGAPFDTAETYP